MKKKIVKMLKKDIKLFFGVFCFLMLVWLVISFFNINANNGIDGNGPASWNLFDILLNMSK